MILSWFGRRNLLRRWRTCDGLEDVRAEAGSWPANTRRPYVADRLTQQPDAVLSWWSVIAVNSSRILPLSLLDACWYRSRIVATSSCFADLLMPPPTWLPPEFSVTFLSEATQ